MTKDFLKDQVCLVTGGAQGIGWATARRLAAAGGTVYVCDISEEHLELASGKAAELPWPGRFHFAPCDVADRQQVEGWCAGVLEKEGRIDVLVNNAAFVRWEKVVDMAVEDVERTMAVGFNAFTASSSVATGTPSQRAVLMKSPPTSLLMHSSVCHCDAAGSARTSSYVRLTGAPTRPMICRRQPASSTRGSTRFLETR